MASVAAQRSVDRRWPSRWTALRHRLAPAEGWSVVLLHAVIILAAAWTVRQTEWLPDRSLLTLASLGGLLVGLVLGKLRAPDLFAHLVAFWSGLAVVVVLTVERLDAIPGGRRERLRVLWELALAWYRDTLAGRRVDDVQLFAVVMGLTIWLVAYTSAWVLYRRGWLTTALVLPGIIAVVNLGYAPTAGTVPLLVYVVAACLLAARHHAYRREREWARTRMPRPPRLSWRFLGAGVNLALLAVVLGWTLPLSARGALVDAAWQRLERPWSAIVERWEEWFADWGGPDGSSSGSYSAFGESFRLGGELDLADDPVALLRGDERPRPTYLVGHRYNRYDGHGWASDVEETFEEVNADGDRYSSQMSFASGQGVHLSPEVLTARSEVESSLTVLRPKGNILFSTDTYLTADRRTNVQLSWWQLRDEPFDLRDRNLNAIPIDLRRFALLLQRAEFPVPDTGARAVDSPTPTDPDLTAEIADERVELRKRFLNTRWVVGRDGKATTLYVTGQIPVYDDVEAVFADDPVAEGQTYTVTALASTAIPAELRRAGTGYPQWVRDRYLQVPDTITPRTRQLAAELAAGQPTPFDVALAVQDHVRARIAYEEDIDAPPRDQDVVDYVLFDSRQGYCEYYASAMAVLLRTQGIPARVVGGYFAVPYDPDQGGFLYREKNAHLWVEVFFPGYGWIPFEPTAARAPLDYGDLAAPTGPLTTADAEPTPAPTAAPTAVATPEAPPAAAPTETDDRSLLERSTEAFGWASFVAGLIVIVGILAASLVWLWGFRGLTPAGGFYARALRAGRWLGVRPSPAMTPSEYADRLGRAVPSARWPAHLVADLYGQELYAGRPPAPAAARSARSAWTDLRRALLRALLLRRRGTEGLERG